MSAPGSRVDQAILVIDSIIVELRRLRNDALLMESRLKDALEERDTALLRASIAEEKLEEIQRR
jgi:hypothetical protein